MKKAAGAQKLKNSFPAPQFKKKVGTILKRIKRTKITVIRTESVFLKMQTRAAEYLHELHKIQADNPENKESGAVSESKEFNKKTKSEGKTE